MTGSSRETASEFELIDLLRSRLGCDRADVRVGIGDDAAILDVPRGRQLVVTMDALNAGVHFPADSAPADVATTSVTMTHGPTHCCMVAYE